MRHAVLHSSAFTSSPWRRTMVKRGGCWRSITRVRSVELRRLLISVGIVAVGLGVIAHLMHPGVIGIREVTRGGVSSGPPQSVWFLVQWFIGTSLIGFGLLHPFQLGRY